MEGLTGADIFFYISSVVLVFFSVLGIIALVYVIKFLKDLRDILHIVREESEHIIDDVELFRKSVEHKATKVSQLLGVITTARFIKRFFGSNKKK